MVRALFRYILSTSMDGISKIFLEKLFQFPTTVITKNSSSYFLVRISAVTCECCLLPFSRVPWRRTEFSRQPPTFKTPKTAIRSLLPPPALHPTSFSKLNKSSSLRLCSLTLCSKPEATLMAFCQTCLSLPCSKKSKTRHNTIAVISQVPN